MVQLDTSAEALRAALLSLDRIAAERIVFERRSSGSLVELMDGLIVPVLEGIGHDWESGRLALSEVYMAGRLASAVVEAVLSAEPAGFTRPQPRIGAVVLEDAHVLGKRIVEGLLRTSGYHVDDLGQNLCVDDTVAAVRAHGTQVLLVSVLMLRSALLVADLKHRLADEGLDVRIMVGGAPFRLDGNLWREVGADACGKTASDALEMIPRLTEAR